MLLDRKKDIDLKVRVLTVAVFVHCDGFMCARHDACVGGESSRRTKIVEGRL